MSVLHYRKMQHPFYDPFIVMLHVYQGVKALYVPFARPLMTTGRDDNFLVCNVDLRNAFNLVSCQERRPTLPDIFSPYTYN